jgi:hypothetical protein
MKIVIKCKKRHNMKTEKHKLTQKEIIIKRAVEDLIDGKGGVLWEIIKAAGIKDVYCIKEV